MRILMPIFPRNEEERRLLEAGVRKEGFVSRSIARLAELAEFPATVLSDCVEVRPLADLYGADFHLLPSPGRGLVQTVLPQGLESAFAFAVEVLGWEAEDFVLVLDYRTPMLTPELIRQACATQRAAPERVLASVQDVVDHPAQMDRYYRLNSLNVLCLREDRQLQILGVPIGDEDFISTPFFFNWSCFGLGDPTLSGLYKRLWVERFPYLVPVDDFSATRPEETYYLRAGAQTARRVARNCVPSDVVGFPFYADMKHVAAFLAPFGDKYCLYVDEEMVRETDIIRIWRLPADGHVQQRSHDIYPMDESRTDRLYLPGVEKTYVGPFGAFCKEDLHPSFVVAFLKVILDGAYDIIESLDLDQNLWKFDTKSGQRINLLQNKQILGRQDFPSVLLQSSCMSIVSYTHLDRLINFDAAHVVAYKVSLDTALLVRYELDILRLNAILKVLDLNRLQCNLTEETRNVPIWDFCL